MKRPKCERKGTLPHPATHALTWNLSSGRVTKFFCDEHFQGCEPAATLHLETDWLLRAGEGSD